MKTFLKYTTFNETETKLLWNHVHLPQFLALHMNCLQFSELESFWCIQIQRFTKFWI